MELLVVNSPVAVQHHQALAAHRQLVLKQALVKNLPAVQPLQVVHLVF